MLKLEEFSVVKLRNDQLFTVVGGEKSTTWTSSSGCDGTDTVLDNRVSTRYYETNGGHVAWMDRENDGNL